MNTWVKVPMLIRSFTRSMLEKMCLQGGSPILRKTCVQSYFGHSVSPCNCVQKQPLIAWRLKVGLQYKMIHVMIS
jgi:hypothetical protein